MSFANIRFWTLHTANTCFSIALSWPSRNASRTIDTMKYLFIYFQLSFCGKIFLRSFTWSFSLLARFFQRLMPKTYWMVCYKAKFTIANVYLKLIFSLGCNGYYLISIICLSALINSAHIIFQIVLVIATNYNTSIDYCRNMFWQSKIVTY